MMNRQVRLLATLVGLVFVSAAVSAAIPHYSIGQTANTLPAVLTPAELRGKNIYLRGESSSGKEIIALAGELELPATSMTCANCHGSRGEGLVEGGITSGNVTWSHLTNPKGHVHDNRRTHITFDEESVARATINCVDPSGNKLHAAMPCYRLSTPDMADLVAYLKRIENDRDPGLTDTTITIGAIVPTQGPLTELGGATKGMLTAYFEELNLRGGIKQRKVELRFAEMGNDAAATANNAKSLVESGQVFAFVGGLSTGADKELVTLAQAHRFPFIGPTTLLPETVSNDFVFYLLPGMSQQARALVNYAANKPGFKASKLLLVLPNHEVALRTASSIEDQARKLEWAFVRHGYDRRGFNAPQLVEKLKAENSDVLFFLGSGEEAGALMKAVEAANWTPYLFLFGVGGTLTDSPPIGFKDRVFLTFPTVPGDVKPEALAEFRRLQEKYKRHDTSARNLRRMPPQRFLLRHSQLRERI